MIRYLIKNNFKLMLRNKWIITVMILGPVLVTMVLSSAFQELLRSYEGVDEFQAGYRVEAGSVMENSILVMKNAGKEAGIIFTEYPEGEPKELMENNELAGFVEFHRDTYTVYESDDYVTEGIILEYFLNRCMSEGLDLTLQAAGLPMQNVGEQGTEDIEFPRQRLDYMPAIDAVDYYGIIEIVYFTWLSVIFAAEVLTEEKKNGIGHRFQVISLSNFKLYLSKWIPITLATTIGIGIAVVVTMLLFDIHWGNIFLSAAVMMLLIMASASFGLMLYYFFKNLAVTVVVLFTLVWIMGFLGGSFETYMYSSTSDILKNVSPIYHVNRALVEYSCMGHSMYTKSCMLYLLAVIVGCTLAAVLTEGFRKGGRE